MSNIYESYHYDVSYRATLSPEDRVKVFMDKAYLEVDSSISFDRDYDNKTSLNYFAASIISSIIHSVKACAKREKILICDIEGKIKLQLKNPLTILAVKGYDEKPRIERCEIQIYLYSELTDDDLQTFCKKALEYCFIYTTLKNSMNLSVSFIPIL